MVPEMILAIEGPHPTSSNLQSFDSCNLLLKNQKWWENSQSDYGSTYVLLQKCYFISKIVLTYCEKIFNSFKQFFEREFFLTYYWRFLRLNASTQSKCQSSKSLMKPIYHACISCGTQQQKRRNQTRSKYRILMLLFCYPYWLLLLELWLTEKHILNMFLDPFYGIGGLQQSYISKVL